MFNFFVDISVFGALLLAGMYFITFFAVRRGKISPLYFGFFALLMAINICFKNTDIANSLAISIPERIHFRISYSAFALGLIFLGLYFLNIYNKYTNKNVISFYSLTFLIIAVLIWIINESDILLALTVFSLILLSFLMYLLYCVWKAIKAKKLGSKIFFTATILLLISVVFDFLFTNKAENAIFILPVSLFIFVLLQAVFISLKNSQISEEKSMLETELDYHNHNLEKIIKEKTRDIETMKVEMTDQQDFLQDLQHQLEERKEDLQAQSEMLDVVNKALDQERKKSESLLLNILPEKVAEELKETGESKPTVYPEASVLFTDFVGFSKIAANMPPEELIKELHFFFALFDDIVEKYDVDKIKTIGDAYFCASGILDKPGNKAAACVMAGLEISNEMLKILEQKQSKKELCFEIRIGIHTGPVISGIVGKTKFAFDIWGDTVNTAKRIEAACNPGELYISSDTYERIKDYFNCESRGIIKVKHRGNIEVYSVLSLNKNYCDENDEYCPNDDFFKVIGKNN